MQRCKSCGQSLSNEDLISQLPEALLLQILSLLPTKDVVAMSVLSKRWRSLWKMVPNLEFDYDASNDLERFSDYVSRCLLSHQAPVLQSLRLGINFDDDDDHMDIGLLMGLAFGRQLRQFVLEVYSENWFRFPTSLFNCQTLVSLKLGYHILVDVPSPVCMKSLRTLHLYRVDYKGDESVHNLLSGCPSLENLEIHQFEEFNVETFTIAVPSLQRLKLTADIVCVVDSVFVINAPSLKYLEIEGFLDDGSCLIENTPELVEASVSFVSDIVFENIIGSITSVQRLSLNIVSPLEIKSPTGSIFNQLRYLELHTTEPKWWNLLTPMLDSSPNLQVLKLIGSWYRRGNNGIFGRWNQPKYVPEYLLPSLETLVWTYYEGEIENDKEVAKYILRNASRLKKATFSSAYICPDQKLDRFKELETVVLASSSCQLVFKEFDILSVRGIFRC